MTVTVEVHNRGGVRTDIELDLRANGKFVASERVLILPRETRLVQFSMEPGTIRAVDIRNTLLGWLGLDEDDKETDPDGDENTNERS